MQSRGGWGSRLLLHVKIVEVELERRGGERRRIAKAGEIYLEKVMASIKLAPVKETIRAPWDSTMLVCKLPCSRGTRFAHGLGLGHIA